MLGMKLFFYDLINIVRHVERYNLYLCREWRQS